MSIFSCKAHWLCSCRQHRLQFRFHWVGLSYCQNATNMKIKGQDIELSQLALFGTPDTPCNQWESCQPTMASNLKGGGITGLHSPTGIAQLHNPTGLPVTLEHSVLCVAHAYLMGAASLANHRTLCHSKANAAKLCLSAMNIHTSYGRFSCRRSHTIQLALPAYI